MDDRVSILEGYPCLIVGKRVKMYPRLVAHPQFDTNVSAIADCIVLQVSFEVSNQNYTVERMMDF